MGHMPSLLTAAADVHYWIQQLGCAKKRCAHEKHPPPRAGTSDHSHKIRRFF